jgi:hypothetical protein
MASTRPGLFKYFPSCHDLLDICFHGFPAFSFESFGSDVCVDIPLHTIFVTWIWFSSEIIDEFTNDTYGLRRQIPWLTRLTQTRERKTCLVVAEIDIKSTKLIFLLLREENRFRAREKEVPEEKATEPSKRRNTSVNVSRLRRIHHRGS